MWHGSFVCGKAPSYVDSVVTTLTCTHAFICVTNFFHSWHNSFMCGTTHSYVERVVCHVALHSLILLSDVTYSSVTWFMHTTTWCSARTHSYWTWLIRVWHDSLICRARRHHIAWHTRILMIDVTYSSVIWSMHTTLWCPARTHSYLTWLIRVWHDSDKCRARRHHVVWHTRILMSDMTYSRVMCIDSYATPCCSAQTHSYLTWLIRMCPDTLIYRARRHHHVALLTRISYA